ncbi:unnamed protein product [Darwinula stevensoni]|uniref:Uncharacterized protein n=1 Tax=Darwinula stevensoni TaxID=69355 RepID=A0A7R8X4J6_9CRUS|nr:unnamed protein product [Darwinula stevensoni]CAG0879732.1 unnamed protein product [Darwinula stevensoni]
MPFQYHLDPGERRTLTKTLNWIPILCWVSCALFAWSCQQVYGHQELPDHLSDGSLNDLEDRSSSCPAGCHCDDNLFKVDCEGAGLEVVPNMLHPEIRHLNLRNNKIKQIPDVFGAYKSLETLILAKNQISAVSASIFQSLIRLGTLDLSDNNIASIEEDAFRGLAKLSTLNLSFNRLDNLPVDLFSRVPSLVTLELEGNQLRTLSEHFQNISNLRSLNLARNHLDGRSLMVLTGTPRLLKLCLAHNKLGGFSSERLLFQGLEELDLSDCSLSRLDLKVFQGMKNLKKLSLSGNSLKTVPSGTFKPLENLVELHLDETPLTEIKGEAFAPLKRLEVLDLAKCRELKHIHPHALLGLLNLRMLNLTFTHDLKVLEDESLTGALTLRELHLRGSGLTHLGRHAVAWRDLHVLDLHGCPLNCDCDILWLQRLPLHHNASCHTPAKFHDTLVSDLKLQGCVEEPSPSSNLALILGLIAGIGSAVAGIVAIIVWLLRRRRLEKRPPPTGASNRGSVVSDRYSAIMYHPTQFSNGGRTLYIPPSSDPSKPVPITEL